MDAVNAIAKARFSSVRPQRIQLHRDEALVVELLCLEAGQKLKVAAGAKTYYVIAGTAEIAAGGTSQRLPAGNLSVSAPREPHELINAAEQRLMCLAVGRADGSAGS